MKSPDNIPGWLILDESGIPGAWFRTRRRARVFRFLFGGEIFRAVRTH